MSEKFKPIRVQIVSSQSSYIKNGQFAYIVGASDRGGMSLMDRNGESKSGEVAYLVSKTKESKGGALWFSESAVRLTGSKEQTKSSKSLESLFLSAKEAAELGSRSRGIAAYRLFNDLHVEDQRLARSQYPYKSVGAKYDFLDEHYFYPVNKFGRLFSGRGARRVLGLSNKAIVSGEIEKLGYRKNKGW